MFLSSKQIPKTYHIWCALESTWLLLCNLLEPGFYHWNPVCLKLERRARLSAKPNPPAKEQRKLSPLCFLFQYIHGLNASFIISTLACFWTKACIKLRTNCKPWAEEMAFRQTSEVGIKVFMIEIYSSRRINSALLALDPPSCSSLDFLSLTVSLGLSHGTLPSFLWRVQTLFVVRLSFVVLCVFEGLSWQSFRNKRLFWIVRGIVAEGKGFWLFPEGHTLHLLDFVWKLLPELDIFDSLYAACTQLALRRGIYPVSEDQTLGWFRDQALYQNSICVTKGSVHWFL